MIQAVIFDMDGVIVDSEPLHIKAERKTLSPFHLNLSNDEFHKYMGRTPRIFLEGIIRDYHLQTTADALLPNHMKTLARLYQDDVLMIPGAFQLIQNLFENHFKIGLASSSDRNLIHIVLDKFNLSPFFSAVIVIGVPCSSLPDTIKTSLPIILWYLPKISPGSNAPARVPKCKEPFA